MGGRGNQGGCGVLLLTRFPLENRKFLISKLL